MTVSISTELRQATQRVAEECGVPFSSVVTSALESWIRGRLVDAWLADYQAEFGAFDETELRELAADAGVPYVPSMSPRPSA